MENWGDNMKIINEQMLNEIEYNHESVYEAIKHIFNLERIMEV